ncbi:Rv3235 family protein [Catenulispora acidiphila]|uniref:Rv3235 family protein n=1 Tax=Catenulispora acidiphila TaxID=304895 RepID=UPI00117DD899|nr:Rv3235 family protein [Catenulispora acidiphila]
MDAVAEIEIETGAFGDSDEEGEFSAGERAGGESRSSGRGSDWADGERGSAGQGDSERADGESRGSRHIGDWADSESLGSDQGAGARASAARLGSDWVDGESRGSDQSAGARANGQRLGGDWADGESLGSDQSAGARPNGQRLGGDRSAGSQDSDDAGLVPSSVDAWSPEYAKVWRPLSGAGREPRPGLLVSVVRAGAVVAYPTPLPDPPTGALARALARLERPAVERRPHILPIEAAPAPAPPRRPAPSQKTYGEVRALVGVLVEILRGHRAATHAARWTDPEVRGKLRTPRYARTASLKSVRLAESGDGVEALALLQEGGRTHVVALRFDRAEDSRWRCTALQTG